MSERSYESTRRVLITGVAIVGVFAVIATGMLAVRLGNTREAQEVEALSEFRQHATSAWSSSWYDCEDRGVSVSGRIPGRFHEPLRVLILQAQIPQDGTPARQIYDVSCRIRLDVQGVSRDFEFIARKHTGAETAVLSYLATTDRFNQIFVVHGEPAQLFDALSRNRAP